MTSTLYELVIPNLLFFFAIFLFFLALQTAIVFFIEWIERKNHDWIMVFILYCYRHFRNVQTFFEITGLLLVLVAVSILSSILKSADEKPEITLFAVGMLLTITLLYFILTRLKGKFNIRRASDRVLYFALSMILYLSILLLIDQQFPHYQRFVYKNIVIPAVAEVERTLDINKADQLLYTFRAMEQNGQCPFKNYLDALDTTVIHNFLYISTDRLPRKDPQLPHDPRLIIKGNNCTNGTETFMHSVTGAWYWVTDSARN